MSTVSSKTKFAIRIAEGVFDIEVKTQRMMGCDWVDTYNRALAAYEQAFNFVLDLQDRPAVYPQHRGFITGKGLPL